MHKIVIDAQTIAASGSYTSEGVSLEGYAGYFALYWDVSGDGTAAFTYLSSPDGENFVEQTAVADKIATAQVKTSGPGSDGVDMDSFHPIPLEAVKIKVAETGTSDTITVTAILVIRR